MLYFEESGHPGRGILTHYSAYNLSLNNNIIQDMLTHLFTSIMYSRVGSIFGVDFPFSFQPSLYRPDPPSEAVAALPNTGSCTYRYDLWVTVPPPDVQADVVIGHRLHWRAFGDRRLFLSRPSHVISLL